MLVDHSVETVLGSVRVRVGGSGDAMVFWPSLLMTGDMWAAQADHFGTGHQVSSSIRPASVKARSSRTLLLSKNVPAALSTSSTASV